METKAGYQQQKKRINNKKKVIERIVLCIYIYFATAFIFIYIFEDLSIRNYYKNLLFSSFAFSSLLIAIIVLEL